MRTTLSLDPDVAVFLERLQRERKLTFKETVNQALRLGLQQLSQPPRRRKRFVTRAVDLGQCKLPSMANTAEALAFAEGEDFK